MDMKQFSQKSYNFGADLYKELSTEPNVNVIYSPLSIQTCLSMVYLAAHGNTANEMAKLMKYEPNQPSEQIAAMFETIMEGTEKENGLEIANRIYVMKNYKLKSSFNEMVAKSFKSGIESLDFTQNAQSAKKINSWVEEKTKNKIKDLISADALNGDTRAVLVNAIYFKGKWLHQFKVSNTSPMPFWSTVDSSNNVDTMYIKESFKYGVLEDFDATALEMEYRDSNISMMIILPNKRDGLKNLEAKIHDLDVSVIESKLYKQKIEVYLPKFEFEFTKELTSVLKKLGMVEAFSHKADFSGLLESNEPLTISSVIHKAFIKVDEEGAEAAAATAVIVMAKCMPMPSPEFRADHPFVFFLFDRINKSLLFSGNIKQLATK